MVFIYFLVLVLAVSSQAVAHPDVILQCDKNLKVPRVMPVGDPVFYENGLIGERYSRSDNPNKVDIEALTPAINNEPHSLFPTFYVVDLDLDGEPDMMYRDVTPEGVTDIKKHCENIQEYRDLADERTNPQKGM